MATTLVATWRGKEYDRDPKSADWYWSLGIITIAGILAAIIFGAYLIAVLIAVAAVALALHAAKQPVEHEFRLTDSGLFIGEELHPFDRMISFSMLEDIEGELPPVLSLKTEDWHSQHLMIPLAGVDADKIYDYLLDHVDEVEHRHTVSDLVAAWLGF